MSASLPDSDQRLGLKHRGITHSIIGLLVFSGGLFGLFWLITSFLSTQALALPEIGTINRALLIVLPLACLFHIIADAITIRGVRLFWPSKVYIRFLPKAWTIKNAHWTEYLTVMALITLMGIGIATHILGF